MMMEEDENEDEDEDEHKRKHKVIPPPNSKTRNTKVGLNSTESIVEYSSTHVASVGQLQHLHFHEVSDDCLNRSSGVPKRPEALQQTNLPARAEDQRLSAWPEKGLQRLPIFARCNHDFHAIRLQHPRRNHKRGRRKPARCCWCVRNIATLLSMLEDAALLVS